MKKVILICGKICSGKSTYAKELCRRNNAVLLSIDEIMLSIFGQHCGDKHDEYADRTKKYLLEKAIELSGSDIGVVLDWGFWQKQARDEAREFFESNGIGCELHYIDISDVEWTARLNKRNSDILSGKTLAYYVDDNLAAKFASRFEAPERDEIDVWVSVG